MRDTSYELRVLARKIIRRRQELGLSRADLSKLAGVGAETLARIESARHTPSVTHV